MKHNKSILVDRAVLLFAFRYSLERTSYASYLIMNTIRDNIDNISTEDIKLYIKEINESINDEMDFDKESWRMFVKELESELKKR